MEERTELENLLVGIRSAEGGQKIQGLGSSLIVLLKATTDERKLTLSQLHSSRDAALVKDKNYKRVMHDLSSENEDLLEQLDTMKLIYSLRKGMSQEDSLRVNYEELLDSMQLALGKRDGEMSEMIEKNKMLANALKKTKEERNMILEKYQKLEDRFGRDRSIQDLSRCSSFSQKLPVLPTASSRSSSVHSRSPSQC